MKEIKNKEKLEEALENFDFKKEWIEYDEDEEQQKIGVQL